MLRRLFALFMVAILVSATLVDTAKAIAVVDENFYSKSEIYFYDPTCKTETGVGAITLSGKDNLEKILSFFMGKGLTLEQASGFAGNMMAESGLDPTIIQGGAKADDEYIPQAGIGFGLVQWTSGGRQVKLHKFMTDELGVKITDLGGQLQFAWKEISEDYPSTLAALKATNDPVQAAVVVHDGYEKSADTKNQVITNRGGNATNFHSMYFDSDPLEGSGSGSDDSDISVLSADNKSTSGSTARGGCAGGEFGGGDLAQTAMAYAWPNYIPAGGSTSAMPGYEGRTIKSTDLKEDYSTAVDRAVGAGRYVGGTFFRAVDCGGFVTTLMVDSGFETEYNYGSFISKGAGYTVIQETWLKEYWQQLTPDEVADASNRQPGDVAINNQHTYVYVGDIFPSKIASASLNERAPMQGTEGVTDSSFRWYRKAHNVEPVDK